MYEILVDPLFKVTIVVPVVVLAATDAAVEEEEDDDDDDVDEVAGTTGTIATDGTPTGIGNVTPDTTPETTPDTTAGATGATGTGDTSGGV